MDFYIELLNLVLVEREDAPAFYKQIVKRKPEKLSLYSVDNFREIIKGLKDPKSQISTFIMENDAFFSRVKQSAIEILDILYDYAHDNEELQGLMRETSYWVMYRSAMSNMDINEYMKYYPLLKSMKEFYQKSGELDESVSKLNLTYELFKFYQTPLFEVLRHFSYHDVDDEYVIIPPSIALAIWLEADLSNPFVEPEHHNDILSRTDDFFN